MPLNFGKLTSLKELGHGASCRPCERGKVGSKVLMDDVSAWAGFGMSWV